MELSVRALLDDGDVREARVVVQEALEAGRSRVDLLWTLADIEFRARDLVAARSHLMEAFAASDKRAAAICRRISALRRNRLWRDALLAVEEIPADMRGDALVRAEVGAFYRDCGCYAYATDTYGSQRSLGSRGGGVGCARAVRRLSSGAGSTPGRKPSSYRYYDAPLSTPGSLMAWRAWIPCRRKGFISGSIRLITGYIGVGTTGMRLCELDITCPR